MTQPDYRGARGSNAGDDFHELWALRQALALLDQDTSLTAVTVEGLRAKDEIGTPLDTWEGVDCTFYFGGDDVDSAESIIVDQLKYSAANPERAWTVARLTYSSNKKQDNSVISRLAVAFDSLRKRRPDLVSSGNLVIRLVSNQEVDPAVIEALSNQGTSGKRSNDRAKNRAALLAASGLQGDDFEAFAQYLDLSECGQGSRFALEERVLSTISEWTDDDARTSVNDLMRFIRRAMMPEAKGEIITRQSILARLGFSDPQALFPCPSAIRKVARLVPRDATRLVTERMLNGDQRICLHGEGGSGKTTALQEIETLLPEGSAILIFDCYGGGRYLDSDAYRHRPPDAFLQLSNDLARLLRTPLLVSRSPDLDYPRVFKKRLEKAAEVVASETSDALLVIAIDAADNSVTAAKTRSPEERSFVHDFVALGNLPDSVRFIVTGRTGRLQTLELPPAFTLVKIEGFGRDETAAHVRGIWDEAPDSWIDDFHYLSRGNPRVQRYALDYAGSNYVRALDYLRPHGKGLDNVFREQLDHARRKIGREQDIKVFCAGLVALPRPIPVEDLSVVTGLSEAHLCDLCADLAPGVRLADRQIGFADEDFEHFMRIEAATHLTLIRTSIADHFLSRHKTNAYAASHIAGALLEAGRGQGIIDLINSEQEPTAIGDPVLRREAQLQRLRIAMKVCREIGNDVDAMLTLLIGAEALKTDAAIRSMLIENPDLAANFARDTSSRILLRDPDYIENHGPLLFHLMAADAREGDGISVREGHRQLRAWLQRRADDFREQKARHPHTSPHGWSIDEYDIAAETEAVLRIEGPRRAVETLLRWKPRRTALQVALILSFKLIISGDEDLLQRCVVEAGISAPWDLFLLTPLALTGKQVDLSRLEASLVGLLRRRLVRINTLRETWREDDPTADYLEIILTACEIIISRGGNRASVIPVLEQIADPEARRRDRLFTSQVSLMELSLRAHVLLERMAGRQPTLQTYLIDPPRPAEALPDKERNRINRSETEKKEELEAFIGPFMELYDVRAQLLLGTITTEIAEEPIRKAVSRSHQDNYRLRREHRLPAMRKRAALSLTRLMSLPNLDRTILLKHALSVLTSGSFSSAETEIFDSLAIERSLHQQILSAITARAETIKQARTSAEEKIAVLVRFARLLILISHADAESLFNDAVLVAGEVNAEAIYEIGLFAPLAKRAADVMEVSRKRAVARDLAITVSDTSIRLEGQDNFPWSEAAKALTYLDVCIALAADGRWGDAALVDRETFLPPILEAALSRRDLSPVQVTALSPLLDNLEIELIGHVIDEAKVQGASLDTKVLSEELAREELLRFGQGKREEVSHTLVSIQSKDRAGFWLSQLLQATAFHKLPAATQAASSREKEHSVAPDEIESRNADPFSSIDWKTHRFITTEEIDGVINRVLAAARASETFISTSAILERISSSVALGDRVSHLEALSRNQFSKVSHYELGRAISSLVETWSEAPSVRDWGRKYLLRLIIDQLPAFIGYLVHGDSPLPALLKKSGASDEQICTALLEAMERHVDSLNAPTVYTLVGLIGQYCAPGDAARVIERYAERLVKRIPVGDRDNWDLADIPENPEDGLARFLYTLMGDIDVRNRWRAAHSARSLARLGAISILDKLVELYTKTSERSYCRPDAPFYWLASRLWLVIALDRIAIETPAAIQQHGIRLLEIASDDEFPHLLLRSFAKSTVSKLVESQAITLDSKQLAVLERSNTSPLSRKKSPKSRNATFNKYQYEDKKGRRFTFNSMDTLPYWYSGAVKIFADLNKEEFLDAAEHWIVERWGVLNDPWTWEAELRKDRLSDRALSSGGHSHGSLPTGERFNTHLEWHAMWCAIGELMRSHPLAKLKEDDYESFENRLGRANLTAPPLWLADLRSMKPLEERFWFAPQGDIDLWIETARDSDFLAELEIASDSETIVVGGYHETRSRNFNLTVTVDTALVSPSTAGALMRALQTVDDPYDYGIPSVGDHLEINAPPYRLKGWLDERGDNSGIDERDPLRYDVGPIQRLPSSEVVSALHLEFIYENQPKWVQGDGHNTIFGYESWSDNRWDDYDDRSFYGEGVRSNGWRLRVNREALATFLTKARLDLIVEIQINRKNKGYEYSEHHEKETKEGRFDRVILLRRDGTIEAAERCFGPWKTSRP